MANSYSARLNVQKKLFTGIVAASAVVYSALLFYMLFKGFGRAGIKLSETMRFNLVPFKTIMADLTAVFGARTSGHAFRNLTGNLFLLCPLGFYLPFFAPKLISAAFYAVAASALIITIEVAQLLTLSGSLDIDDFILNFAGAFIGLLICKYTPVRALFKLRAY